MSAKGMERNRRILVVDDNHSIHADFKKILAGPGGEDLELAAAEAELFGHGETGGAGGGGFELTSAFQGQEGLECVKNGLAKGERFAVAFVDVRMPPGWDGIETTQRLWEVDPDLQVVICTAFSDYSWEQMSQRLGMSDRLLILKKPFDSIEVLQLANTLCEKWGLLQESRKRFETLEEAVRERTQELQATNAQLSTLNSQLSEEVQERRAVEQALRAAQEQLDHMLAKSPAILFSLRTKGDKAVEGGEKKADGKSTDFEPAWVTENFCTLTGFESSCWYLQTPSLEYVDAQDRQMVREAVENLQKADRSETTAEGASADKLSLVYRVRHRDGGLRWVRDDRVLLRNARGDAAEIIGCWTDITEQRRLEDQLRQAQKMESVGQLAGGVAHDFNNLLMVILGHVDMLLNPVQGSELPEDAVDSLRRIHVAAERAGNLTRQLLAFSRKQVMRPTRLDLREVLSGMGQLLGRTLGEHVRVVWHCEDDVPPLVADRSMIEQVVMNLAINARDAMPDGGQLSVDVGVRELDETCRTRCADARPGKFVLLTVADNGCGIPESILPRIFEPFFTTKEVGKGTGLGLATVYGNVKQHNGWVEVESAAGKGTTFRVFLPITSNGAASAEDKKPSRTRPLRGGRETILVVEDESSLGKLINITLQRQGYKIYTASSGAEARAAWAGRLDEIDLLLTDIVMPDGLGGWELGREFQSLKPTLKIIYMSGYNEELAGKKPAWAKDIRFLEKPFGPQELAHAVRDCLDAGGGALGQSAQETLAAP